jgi:polysaccharide export outer membrane protein
MKRLFFGLVIAISLFAVTHVAAAEDANETGYKIGINDVLEVSVLQPEQLVTPVTVAPDGSITFPYIGNVIVKGRTLGQIQEEIQTRLADGYMKYPVVSVSLLESRSRKFFVYGEVARPGTYQIHENVTVLKAISMAGGFSKYGSASSVKVLRPRKEGAGYDTIKVSIKGVMNGHSESDILVQPEDVVVVSEGIF